MRKLAHRRSRAFALNSLFLLTKMFYDFWHTRWSALGVLTGNFQRCVLLSAESCPTTQEQSNTGKMSSENCGEKCQRLEYGGKAVVPTSQEDFNCLIRDFGPNRAIWSGIMTAMDSSILVDNLTGRAVGFFGYGEGPVPWPLTVSDNITRCVYFHHHLYTYTFCDRQPKVGENETGIIRCVCYTGKFTLNCDQKMWKQHFR